MDRERAFNDLGVDAVTGVELMGLLNMSPDDFIDTSRFLRFKDVIDFFKNMPDKNYIINKITVGKPVDRLDHVWGYVSLAQQKKELRDGTEDIMRKIDTFSKVGDETQIDVVKGLQEALYYKQDQARKVNEQMEAYER